VSEPRVSVVVASLGRPLRLRWLLNALDEQTLARDEWELIVVHGYDAATTARFLDDHPLAAAGILRAIGPPTGGGIQARQRNVGWRAGRGRLVAFTDDDCRPEPDWLELLLAAAEQSPGAVVQGATRPDPLERDIFAAPHVHTLEVDPPGRFAQTCNILYPRELLERLGGLDEHAIVGEDIDLSLRAREAGAEIIGEREAVVNHAIEAHTLPGFVRRNLRWRHLAYVVARHPTLRKDCVGGVFWKESHLLALMALAGLAGARRAPAVALMALPYLVPELKRRGPRPVDVAVAAAEVPGRALNELAEILAMAAGSARYRTFVL
jgi:cellulose synthase/poly-beta-1,6-N-acetylglucosamine synthase-like glycosyltransferase